MNIRKRHRNIIEKKLNGIFDKIEIEVIKELPKTIKLHFHVTDGWSESEYLFKINCKRIDQKDFTLYCRLSPIILELYYNVSFWTIGEKWMKRYRLK